MTTMHAATEQLENQKTNGIRRFDIGSDLRPVAELIADAFAVELDERGNAALREMRIMSYVGGFLKLLNRTTGEFDDVFNGYVWVDEGRIVGNVTVQKADRHGSRWQIANVAVAPDCRGRGIARRLMAQAIGHIEDAGGKWAVLQVYEKNAAARNLYDTMSFEYVGGKSELVLDQVPPLVTAGRIAHCYSFSANHWQELHQLANNQLSSQAQWWRPLRSAEFQTPPDKQMSEWLWRTCGRRNIYRRAIQVTNRFEAALILKAERWSGRHEVQFYVRPENYGQYETDLLHWALATLNDYPRWPVTASLTSDHAAALETFQRYGFRVERTLMTMRKKMIS